MRLTQRDIDRERDTRAHTPTPAVVCMQNTKRWLENNSILSFGLFFQANTSKPLIMVYSQFEKYETKARGRKEQRWQSCRRMARTTKTAAENECDLSLIFKWRLFIYSDIVWFSDTVEPHAWFVWRHLITFAFFFFILLLVCSNAYAVKMLLIAHFLLCGSLALLFFVVCALSFFVFFPVPFRALFSRKDSFKRQVEGKFFVFFLVCLLWIHFVSFITARLCLN